jgi:hypothetical protein
MPLPLELRQLVHFSFQQQYLGGSTAAVAMLFAETNTANNATSYLFNPQLWQCTWFWRLRLSQQLYYTSFTASKYRHTPPASLLSLVPLHQVHCSGVSVHSKRFCIEA